MITNKIKTLASISLLLIFLSISSLAQAPSIPAPSTNAPNIPTPAQLATIKSQEPTPPQPVLQSTQQNSVPTTLPNTVQQGQATTQNSTPDQKPQKAAIPPTETQSTNEKPIYDDKLIIIATGAITGVYYPAGGAICRLINRERKSLGIRCAVESTPGSIYNLESLKNGEVDLAIVQSDWQEHAYLGTGYFANKRFADLRFLFSLHDESMTFIVKKDSDIQKFSDIKNHIVNMGPEGSGVRATMEEVMKAKGWSSSNFKNIAEFKPSDQAKALCDSKIDVMILATGHPNASIQELINICDVRIIEVDDPDIDKMINNDPAFSPAIIPGGVYTGEPKDIKTFGIKATVVTTSNLHDDIAYNITKLVFDNIQSFKNLHPVFSLLNPENMAYEGRSAPYHNGAERFYQERGIKTK